MKKRTLVLGGVAALAAIGIVAAIRGGLWSGGAVAQSQREAAPRAAPVEVATAVKKTVPVRVEALGSVTPIASVAIKPRIDSEIVGVHFAMTQVNIYRASVASNTGQLENLNIQLSYCSIRAPISGRASMAAVKVGNFVRQADLPALATVNQTAPIYVSFTVPQGRLADVRQALAAETATLEAIVPGTGARASGQVTMIENMVDLATGMVTIRATMPNEDEVLWPGTLVSTQLTLRTEDAVTVPAAALQLSQTGTFVFVVKDDVATVRPVKVERTVDGVSVIESGVAEGEVVVTDGQLLLSNGTRVTQRKKVSS